MALPDYLQEAGKDFAKQLTAQTAVPLDPGTFMGRQFVAGEDPLQTQAINLATQGIGSFQPFLQGAQQLNKQDRQLDRLDKMLEDFNSSWAVEQGPGLDQSQILHHRFNNKLLMNH